MRRTPVIVAVLFLLSVVVSDAWAGYAYTVTDLGGGYATSINNSGQVVGCLGATTSVYTPWSYGFGGSAFLYSNGTIANPLPTPPVGSSAAYGINASGQIVGAGQDIYDPVNEPLAFRYSDGTVSFLDYPTSSYAYGINATGQAVGYSNDSTYPYNHAFYTSSSGTVHYMTLLGYGGYAFGINDSGQVVGCASSPSSGTGAYIYSTGTTTYLGTLPGGTYSAAFGINNNGQVVGASYTSSSQTTPHAFLYSGSSMQSLGTLGGTYSQANGINSSGQIVGWANTSSGAKNAFLYRASSMQDLNNLISPSSGWILTDALALNDNGRIVGFGITGGQTHAFLLTPNATVNLGSALNASIITGGTATLGTTVSNSAATGANNLNYSLSAAVQSGSATLGSPTPGSGSLAPGVSQACTVSATSTNFGVNTISFTASDPNSTNTSQTTTATLTVLDHSNASLSSTANQTTQTINFGNVLKGATVPSQNFAIYNRAANTTAAYTANLKLTGFTPNGDAALGTTLSTFNNLAAASNNTYTASLNTSNYTTTGSKTVTISAAQLADDSSLSGAGNNNNGAITVTLQGNVGNATADKSNSQSSFGTALTAPVAQNASYINLESKATATTGSGGYGMVGSAATILAGTNGSSSSQTVSMQWRTQTLAERISPMLVSDIVRLGGMSLDGIGSETSPFVLQMSYDPTLLPLGSGSEGSLASNESIYLGWLNPNTNKWDNAIQGNIGTNLGSFQLGAWPNGDMTLGDWGVNTSNHTVWAVLNHNSDFAVVPEPSTFALLGVGAIGLLGFAWRRRRKQ